MNIMVLFKYRLKRNIQDHKSFSIQDVYFSTTVSHLKLNTTILLHLSFSNSFELNTNVKLSCDLYEH